MSKQEVSELKRQFLFLRDHRKQLKLKLNAQEDLLVNGAREPEHRGVCQHLLSKVDYSRVVAAAEHLAPKERLSLVEGVMQFSSELSFLLLYLECLKDSGHVGATAALSHALSRIDFAGVSEGQMRRVLELVVELFKPQERPKLLLGLLESKTFRSAFDSALQKLPDELQELVAPLRAIHEVVARGNQNTVGAEELRAGLRVLLAGGLGGLERRSSGFRERLLSAALTQLGGDELSDSRAISELVDSFKSDKPRHLVWQERYIRALLQTGSGKAADKQLGKLRALAPDLTVVHQLDKLLGAPRVGPFALVRGKGRLPFKSNPPLRSGLCLTSQREVWLRTLESSPKPPNKNASEASKPSTAPARPAQPTPEQFAQSCALEASLLLPSVTPHYYSSSPPGKQPIIAYLKHGENASSALRAPLGASQVAQIGAELVLLSASLAALGWTLPDFSWSRFEVDLAHRLWLLERWDASAVPAAEANAKNLDLVRAQILSLFESANAGQNPSSNTSSLERGLTEPQLEAIATAPSHSDLLRTLRSVGGPAPHPA